MSLSTPFIRRPVATTLLTFGLAAAGAISFFLLPVSPLPQVDFPTISVQASLPGASCNSSSTLGLFWCWLIWYAPPEACHRRRSGGQGSYCRAFALP